MGIILKILVTVACALALVGCVSQEQLAQRRVEFAQAQTDLSISRSNATVYCNGKTACDKAFSLAKIYVQEHSDMKIQISDDTIVSTYNPINYGNVALRATKTPGAGDSATVQLVASCKGMDDDGYFFTMCARRVAPIYRGFKLFIEPKL